MIKVLTWVGTEIEEKRQVNLYKTVGLIVESKLRPTVNDAKLLPSLKKIIGEGRTL